MREQELVRLKASVLKAMGHPSRLAMIEALADGELCVCELQRIVGADVSTVSKHLSVLRNAGIVFDRKRGLQVYYRLCCPHILDFLKHIDAIVRADAEQKMAACCGRSQDTNGG